MVLKIAVIKLLAMETVHTLKHISNDKLTDAPGVELPESLEQKKNIFEGRLNLLGKMAFDIANTNLLAVNSELQPGSVDKIESRSIVEKFLIHICPVFEEEIVLKVGEIGKWRSVNLAQIAHIARMKLLVELSQRHLAVHPRVMFAVIEKGSLTESPVLIEMWANLLVSACTFEQDDERYVSYVYFLENISPGQASILSLLGNRSITYDHLGTCENQEYLSLELSELLELTEAESMSELKLDLTYLESFRLIDADWQSKTEKSILRLTSLGVQFYKSV